MTFFSSEFINTRALIRFEIWRQSQGDFFRDNAKWLEKYLDPDFVKNCENPGKNLVDRKLPH